MFMCEKRPESLACVPCHARDATSTSKLILILAGLSLPLSRVRLCAESRSCPLYDVPAVAAQGLANELTVGLLLCTQSPSSRAQTPEREYLLRVSYLEIYNENITDLLNPKNKDLRIRENVYV